MPSTLAGSARQQGGSVPALFIGLGGKGGDCAQLFVPSRWWRLPYAKELSASFRKAQKTSGPHAPHALQMPSLLPRESPATASGAQMSASSISVPSLLLSYDHRLLQWPGSLSPFEAQAQSCGPDPWPRPQAHSQALLVATQRGLTLTGANLLPLPRRWGASLQGVLGNGAVVVKAAAPAELDSGVTDVPHHHTSRGARRTCTKRSQHSGSEWGSFKPEPTSSTPAGAGAVPRRGSRGRSKHAWAGEREWGQGVGRGLRGGEGCV